MTNVTTERAQNETMLTTFDNPFNPFTDYEKWWNYDFQKGYKTPELLARVAVTSDELSEADEALAIEQAIQDILDWDPLGVYLRVRPDNVEKLLNIVHN